MADLIVYVSGIVRLPLLGADGGTIGRVTDVVIGPPSELEGGPPVRGFVATVPRRQIFVSAARIGWLDARGVQLDTVTVDLRQFRPRRDELLGRSLIGRTHETQTVRDVGISPSERRARGWVVATVALQWRGALGVGGKRRVLGWNEVEDLFHTETLPDDLRGIRTMHPADAARRILHLPSGQQARVLAGLDDHVLANVMEELSESDQVRLLADLDLERAADVVEQMDPDDATDLLGELTGQRRKELLDEIDPAQGAALRRLLSYAADTAGGLMTSDPIVLTPATAVADALARIRQPEVVPALAAQVFVAEPPTQTPTGRFLGSVPFQRLLREPPSSPVADCIEAGLEPVSPQLPDVAVAHRLAAYNLLALPVCDEDGRLLGAITVDDVLDRSLPVDWRQR